VCVLRNEFIFYQNYTCYYLHGFLIALPWPHPFCLGLSLGLVKNASRTSLTVSGVYMMSRIGLYWLTAEILDVQPVFGRLNTIEAI